MERKLDLINPAELDSEGLTQFMERQDEVAEKELGVYIRYRGIEPFLRFATERRIGIGTLIRVTNYGRLVGQCLIITDEGLREHLVEDDKVYTPEEIFNDQLAPHGEGDWEIAGQDYIL